MPKRAPKATSMRMTTITPPTRPQRLASGESANRLTDLIYLCQDANRSSGKGSRLSSLIIHHAFSLVPLPIADSGVENSVEQVNNQIDS